MNLKQFFNKSVYGTIGYITSLKDIELIESYIIYNLPILKEFQQIIVATNYSSNFKAQNNQLWKKYFSNCILIDLDENRGHNFGTADLDNILFDYCKHNNIEWLCKSANDVLFNSNILDNIIEEADFYYLNGISYEDLYKNNFNYENIFTSHFYPQTNFYIINISKCDYLNNKEYLDKTYKHMLSIPNYNGKIWEYIQGWSCENFLKQCVERNKLSKKYLLNLDEHNTLCNTINAYKIGDPSHKNMMIKGICHFQFPEQQILEI
jgi:hypothetical protein